MMPQRCWGIVVSYLPLPIVLPELAESILTRSRQVSRAIPLIARQSRQIESGWLVSDNSNIDRLINVRDRVRIARYVGLKRFGTVIA